LRSWGWSGESLLRGVLVEWVGLGLCGIVLGWFWDWYREWYGTLDMDIGYGYWIWALGMILDDALVTIMDHEVLAMIFDSGLSMKYRLFPWQ